MHEQTINQRIRTAAEHAAPDSLDHILSSCETQKGTVIPMTTPKSKRRWAPLAVAAALVIMCCGAFGLKGWRTANTVDSIVMLDVNPSISLSVNARERVLNVTPLNQDAAAILGGMDLVGTDLDVAVNALIGSMLQKGYLSDLQNAILVSVENQDAARSAQLQQQLSETINAIFQGGSLEGAVLSQTVAEDADLTALANQYSISQGKAALIQDVTAQDSTLTFDALAPLSVNEIALITQSRRLTAPSVTTTGSASDKAYIGWAAAKEEALSHAGLKEGSVSMLEVELDSEDGVMVYEVEFATTSTKYEYDIDARTGAVVKSSQKSRPQTNPVPQGSASGGTSGGTSGGNGGGTSSGAAGSDVGEAAAKSIALTDAGVRESQVTGLRCRLDTDDGVRVYEIEFWVDAVEYEYDVRISDGAILKSKRDDKGTNAGGSGAFIGDAAAKQAALSHAGLSESGVSALKCELDEDDGTYRYEIEFRVGAVEYEYEIDAYSGAVVKAEKDVDD